MALRWTYRWELRHLLELCGFVVEAEHSDFHGAPPAYGKELVVVARRETNLRNEHREAASAHHRPPRGRLDRRLRQVGCKCLIFTPLAKLMFVAETAILQVDNVHIAAGVGQWPKWGITRRCGLSERATDIVRERPLGVARGPFEHGVSAYPERYPAIHQLRRNNPAIATVSL